MAQKYILCDIFGNVVNTITCTIPCVKAWVNIDLSKVKKHGYMDIRL